MRPAALRVFYIVSFAAFGIYLPYFPRWLEARNIEGFAMGFIAAAYPATGLVAPIALGIAADVLRTRSTLLRLAAFLGVAAFATITAFAAVGWPLGALTLVPAVALFSVARTGMTTLADVLSLEHASAAGTSYGRIRLFGSAGFLVAVVVGGRLIDPTSAVTMPLAILLALLGAASVALMLPSKLALPPPPSPGQARALLAAPDVRLFFAMAVIWAAAHSSYDLCYSLYLRDRGVSGSLTGLAWGIGVAAEIALMGLLRPTSNALSSPHVLPLALGGGAVRWLLLARAKSLVVLLALQPLHAVSFALVWLSCLAYIRARAPAGALASAQGLFNSSTAAGAVVGMLTWGPLYRYAGGPTTFVTAAGVAAIGCALAIAFAARRPERVGPKDRPEPVAARLVR